MAKSKYNSALVLFIFFLGIILLSAILSPFLFWFGKYIVSEKFLLNLNFSFLTSLHDSLDKAEFQRYFNRSVLLSLVLTTFLIFKFIPFNLNINEKKNIKYRGIFLKIFFGFFLALLGMFILASLYVNKEWFYLIDPKSYNLYKILFISLLSSLIISLIEEVVFRDIMYKILSKFSNILISILGTSFIFSLVHFLKLPKTLIFSEVNMFSGFNLIYSMFSHLFSRLSNLDIFLAEFLVLFMVGFVLAYFRFKTNSIWIGIGLHSGWVFGIVTFNEIAIRKIPYYELMPWLGTSLRSGLFPFITVCLTGLLIFLIIKKRFIKNNI